MTRPALISLILVGALLSSAEADDLLTPTRLTLKVDNRPLSEALDAFQRATGVGLIVESSIPKEEELLARRVSINMNDRPFWDVIEAINEAATLDLKRIMPDEIVLQSRSQVEAFVKEARGERRAAQSETRGAFFVIPVYAPSDPLELVIRPEPRAVATRLLSYDVHLTFEDGTTTDYRPRRLRQVYERSGEMILRVDEKVLHGHQEIRKLELEAELEVPSDWKTLTLPPLKTMAPEAIAVADGTVRIEQAGLEEALDPNLTEVGLFVHMVGVPITYESGFEQFALVGSDGMRVRPMKVGASKGTKDGIQWWMFDLGFRPDEVPGDLDSYQLAFQLDDGREEVIGPIGTIRPEPTPAGKAKINVDHADFEQGEFEFSVYDFSVPYDRVQLDVGQGSPLEPDGWVWSGLVYPHSFSLSFPVEDVKTHPENWRLVLEAPAESVRHTFRVSLTDVRIDH